MQMYFFVSDSFAPVENKNMYLATSDPVNAVDMDDSSQMQQANTPSVTSNVGSFLINLKQISQNKFSLSDRRHRRHLLVVQHYLLLTIIPIRTIRL